MDNISILIVSVSLAIDAMAISVCKGLSMSKIDYVKAFIISLWFGFFQFLMPFIGYILGSSFQNVVSSIDHWISFILLILIGLNMINEVNSTNKQSDSIAFQEMLVLSVATSLDALAVGIAYVCAYGENNCLLTFFSIGFITFILSFLGVIIGNRYGTKYENKARLFGGIILIIIGIKILLEHLL